MLKTNKKVLWTILLLNLLTIGIYLLFQKTPFHFSHDYVAQYQTFIIRIGQHLTTFIKTGTFPLWDKSLFYGADTIGSLAYYGLGDIWTYVILLFGSKYISIGIVLTYLIKLTLGSYIVYLFLKRNHISEETSFYLALLYNCSFWSVAVFSYINHTNYLLYLPLMLWIAENMIEEKKYSRILMGLLLTISLLNSLIYSFNFSVLVFIYIVVKKYFINSETRTIKQLIKTTLEWASINILAVMASSVIVLPQITLILKTTRAAAHLSDNFFLYILETTLNVVTPNFLVINGFRLSYGMEISSFASFIIIPIIVYGIIKSKYFSHLIEWKIAKTVVLILLVILYVLPINNALNLFTGTYQRWVLFLVIFQLMLSGYVLDYLKTQPDKLKWIIYGTVSLASVGVIINMYFLPKSENPIGIYQDQVISLLFILTMLIIYLLFKKSDKLFKYFVFVNLIFFYSLMGIYHYYCSDDFPLQDEYQINGAYSPVANRGVIYGGSSQLYYNSFINNRMANRTTVLTYSKTLDELSALGIDTALAMARDYNKGMQYLLASPYEERFSLRVDDLCYEDMYCLYPTGYTESKGLLLDKNKTISFEDFKSLNFMDKNRIILEYLISDKTSEPIITTNTINPNNYWVKDGNWYTHTFAKDEEKTILYAQTSTYFCVNKVEDDCDIFAEMTYFDTDIEGIKSISVSTRKLKIKYRTGDLEEPYVEIYPKTEFKLPEDTVDYLWVDANKIMVNLRFIEDGKAVMLPISYDENFKIKGDSDIELIETQLGMLGIDNIKDKEVVIIEYKPGYTKLIPWVYLIFGLTSAFIFNIRKKDNK